MLKTPYKDLLPPLSSSEMEALSASIAAEGVRDPIFVDEDDNILDGHHRYSICPDAPRRVIEGLTEAGKRAFAIAANLQRRNMSPEQRAALREAQKKIAADLKVEGKTQEQIAAMLGVARETIRDWLMPNGEDANAHNDGTLDARVKLTQPAKERVYERIDAGESQSQVAADFGVSQPQVSRIVNAEKKRRDREAELDAQREAIARGEVQAGAGPYDVIVTDPPWPYGTQNSYDAHGFRGGTPYPEMPLDAIASDGIAEIRDKAADDCVLWLWTTHKFMRHSFALIDQWGFEDKAILTWVKDRMGTGRWLRSQSEFCILAVKGSPALKLTNQTTVLHGPLREHSRKPDEFYELVEALCLGPRRYDRFAREGRAGWDVGGNDTDAFAGAAES